MASLFLNFDLSFIRDITPAFIVFIDSVKPACISDKETFEKSLTNFMALLSNSFPPLIVEIIAFIKLLNNGKMFFNVRNNISISLYIIFLKGFSANFKLIYVSDLDSSGNLKPLFKL